MKFSPTKEAPNCINSSSSIAIKIEEMERERGNQLGGGANSFCAQELELFHDAIDEAVDGASLSAAMAGTGLVGPKQREADA